jgi:hypothetical protein
MSFAKRLERREKWLRWLCWWFGHRDVLLSMKNDYGWRMSLYCSRCQRQETKVALD